VAVMGLTDEEVAAWVEASCAAQGVPVKVTDPAVVRSVCVLLGGRGAGRSRQATPAAPVALQPPDGSDPGGVEPCPGVASGLDDGVIQDGVGDGPGLVERERRPGAA
jgi:hypothetical protein